MFGSSHFHFASNESLTDVATRYLTVSWSVSLSYAGSSEYSTAAHHLGDFPRSSF